MQNNNQPDKTTALLLAESQVEVETDFVEMQRQALVSQTETVLKPEIAISITQNGKEFSLCTLGNFMVLTGKAKSRKSFFAHFLIAAALLQGNDGQ